MEIILKDTTTIRPAQETPKHCLRISDLDLLMRPIYPANVYFYRRPGDSSDFFEVGLLKKALSKVLVPFYPVAGRLGKDQNGRIEIRCNGEGVLFLEAKGSCVIDDFGDFSDGYKLLQLVPTVDDTTDVSSNPLLVAQVTHFKCGGVCLGIRVQHTLMDATSTFHFMNSWAEMTRGFPVAVPPFLDRTVLNVGVPTSPKFHHDQYDPPPSMNTPNPNIKLQSNARSISNAILKLSLDQITHLKEILSHQDHGSTIRYSKFEIIVAHIWRCMCKSCGLPNDQVSKLYIPANGRSRLNPRLPYGYLGNAIFFATLTALSGDIQSEPLSYTVKRIHKAVKRMADEYLKSMLAFLKQQPDPMVLRLGSHTYKCPNLMISNLVHMNIYDANFGWGRPIFDRTIDITEGVTHICPSPSNDGSLLLILSLETHQLQLFTKLFYEIFMQRENVRSRY